MRLSNITTALFPASNPVTTRRISEAPAVEPASRTAANAQIILRIMISLPSGQRRLFLTVSTCRSQAWQAGCAAVNLGGVRFPPPAFAACERRFVVQRRDDVVGHEPP